MSAMMPYIHQGVGTLMSSAFASLSRSPGEQSLEESAVETVDTFLTRLKADNVLYIMNISKETPDVPDTAVAAAASKRLQELLAPRTPRR